MNQTEWVSGGMGGRVEWVGGRVGEWEWVARLDLEILSKKVSIQTHPLPPIAKQIRFERVELDKFTAFTILSAVLSKPRASKMKPR